MLPGACVWRQRSQNTHCIATAQQSRDGVIVFLVELSILEAQAAKGGVGQEVRTEVSNQGDGGKKKLDPEAVTERRSHKTREASVLVFPLKGGKERTRGPVRSLKTHSQERLTKQGRASEQQHTTGRKAGGHKQEDTNQQQHTEQHT